jgi:hypothetical protein
MWLDSEGKDVRVLARGSSSHCELRRLIDVSRSAKYSTRIIRCQNVSVKLHNRTNFYQVNDVLLKYPKILHF